ncbi:MAG: helix-turn-helix domain-containing protein [Candidatus Wildermuthbacteria bacterium]|nr:helix-turn-helix domain-containing protein [Candidatus Wildermuthbacteria bacterium]
MATLTKLAGSRTAPASLVLRARLVVRSFKRETVPNIAAAEGVSDITVRKWHGRFNAMGLEGLKDKGGRGRPKKYDRAEIVSLARKHPSEVGESFQYWTLIRLEQYLNKSGWPIGRSQIRRILIAAKVRWQSSSRTRGKNKRPSLGRQATFY